jgi:hypothetical protein
MIPRFYLCLLRLILNAIPLHNFVLTLKVRAPQLNVCCNMPAVRDTNGLSDPPFFLHSFSSLLLIAEFDSRILGLTGPVSAIRQIAQEYRVYFKKVDEEGDDYLVDSSHNM